MWPRPPDDWDLSWSAGEARDGGGGGILSISLFGHERKKRDRAAKTREPFLKVRELWQVYRKKRS